MILVITPEDRIRKCMNRVLNYKNTNFIFLANFDDSKTNIQPGPHAIQKDSIEYTHLNPLLYGIFQCVANYKNFLKIFADFISINNLLTTSRYYLYCNALSFFF